MEFKSAVKIKEWFNNYFWVDTLNALKFGVDYWIQLHNEVILYYLKQLIPLLCMKKIIQEHTTFKVQRFDFKVLSLEFAFIIMIITF